MVLLRNSFEGGTDGVAITVGNSGGDSGDPFDTAGANSTFSTDHASHGQLSGKVVSDATGLVWTLASKTVSTRFYFYVTNATPPSGDNLIFVLSGGAQDRFECYIASGGGQLVLKRGAFTLGSSPASSIVAGNWYRIETVAKSGAPAHIRFKLFEGDSKTAVYTYTQEGAATDDTNFIAQVLFSAQAQTVWFDSLELDDASTDYLGPVLVGNVRVHDGTTFVDHKIRIYDGTAWADYKTRIYDGTAWVDH